MSSYKKIIGANIKRERTERNMSVEELARMLNLSPTFIGLIERGHRGAKLENLIKISDIFGITLDNLICENLPEKINEVRESKYKNQREVKLAAMTSLLYDCNDSELDFLISTIRNLKNLRPFENNTALGYDNKYKEDESNE